MTEEEARRYGYRGPPPPPVTAGTSYGVPTPQAPPPVTPNVVTPYRSASDNPGTVPVPAPPPPAPVAPVGPSVPPTVRRVAPAPVALPPPTPEQTDTLGVTATNQFETPQQRQARELQLRAANEAIATIEGRNVSQAQLQMQRGLNQAQAQQQSQAAGARGMGVAAARRMAARNIAELQQGGVGQAAELRAQETAAARQQLASIADQVRGQDIQTTDSGLAAIDRAKNLANNFEVAMKDLELRSKLGILSDERERIHLAEMERANKAIEDLKARGLNLEAQKLYEDTIARNREFWGGIVTGLGGIGAAVAMGKPK